MAQGADDPARSEELRKVVSQLIDPDYTCLERTIHTAMRPGFESVPVNQLGGNAAGGTIAQINTNAQLIRLNQLRGIPDGGTSQPFIVLSRDGRILVSRARNDTVWVWDLERPDAEPLLLRGVSGRFSAVAISPNGRYLVTTDEVTTSGASTVRLSRLDQPDLTPAVFRVPAGSETLVTFSPDSSRLLLVDSGGRALVWRVDKFPTDGVNLMGNPGIADSAAFSPDGSRLLILGRDRKPRLWSIDRPTVEPIVLDAKGEWVRDVAFSPDGSRIAAVDFGSSVRVRVWQADQPTGAPVVLEWPTDRFSVKQGPVHHLAISFDGSRLLGLISRNSRVDGAVVHLPPLDYEPGPRTSLPRRWDSAAVAARPAGRSSDQPPRSHRFDPCRGLQSRRLASRQRGRQRRDATLASRSSRRSSRSPSRPRWADRCTELQRRRVAIDQPGKGRDDTTLEARPARGQTRDRNRAGGVITYATLSPDGLHLAVDGGPGESPLWRLDQSQPKRVDLARRPDGRVGPFAFSPDGTQLAAAGEDGTPRLWEVKKPTAEPTTFKGNARPIRVIAFSPDGMRLAICCSDGNTRLWRVDRPTVEPVIFKSLPGSPRVLVFTPDGKRVLTAFGGIATARLWWIDQPQLKPVSLTGIDSRIAIAAFSPDSKTLIAVDESGKFVMWRVDDPQKSPLIIPIGKLVEALAFSPDGNSIFTATSSWGHLARLDGTSLIPKASRILPYFYPSSLLTPSPTAFRFLDPSGNQLQVAVQPTSRRSSPRWSALTQGRTLRSRAIPRRCWPTGRRSSA